MFIQKCAKKSNNSLLLEHLLKMCAASLCLRFRGSAFLVKASLLPLFTLSINKNKILAVIKAIEFSLNNLLSSKVLIGAFMPWRFVINYKAPNHNHSTNIHNERKLNYCFFLMGNTFFLVNYVHTCLRSINKKTRRTYA